MSRTVASWFIIAIAVSFVCGYSLGVKFRPVSKVELALKMLQAEIAELETETGYMYGTQIAINGDKLVATVVPLEHVFGGGREIVVDLATGKVVSRKILQ